MGGGVGGGGVKNKKGLHNIMKKTKLICKKPKIPK